MLEAFFLVSAHETSLGTFFFTNLFNECPNIRELQCNNQKRFVRREHNTDQWLENQIGAFQNSEHIGFGFNNSNEFCLGTDCGCNERLRQFLQTHQEINHVCMKIDYTQIKELTQTICLAKNCKYLQTGSKRPHAIPATDFIELLNHVKQMSNLKDIILMNVQPEGLPTDFLKKEFDENQNLNTLLIPSFQGYEMKRHK